jgi:hypothetical protein
MAAMHFSLPQMHGKSRIYYITSKCTTFSCEIVLQWQSWQCASPPPPHTAGVAGVVVTPLVF